LRYLKVSVSYSKEANGYTGKMPILASLPPLLPRQVLRNAFIISGGLVSARILGAGKRHQIASL
jgi:hypothetical protein